jgi:hypothetical protein
MSLTVTFGHASVKAPPLDETCYRTRKKPVMSTGWNVYLLTKLTARVPGSRKLPGKQPAKEEYREIARKTV